MRNQSVANISQSGRDQYRLCQDKWNAPRIARLADGVVVEVVEEDGVYEGFSVRAGAVKVSYHGGAAEKWLKPEQVPKLIRKIRGAHHAQDHSGLSCDCEFKSMSLPLVVWSDAVSHKSNSENQTRTSGRRRCSRAEASPCKVA